MGYHGAMAEPKTRVNDHDVHAFIDTVEDTQRRQDSLVLLDLFTKVTGETPKMWGTSIIGFGQYHYKSERSRQEGDWMLTGFSPRKQALTLYISMGIKDYQDLLDQLGKHTTGKGCLYIKKLSDVDENVLEKIIRSGFEDMKKQYNVR